MNNLPSTKKNWISLFIVLSVCAAVVWRCKGIGDTKPSLQQESSIEAAETAWMQMDLGLSRQILENVWADNGSGADDRVKAAQMLAIQDWKFLRDYAAASDRIKQADALGIKRCITWQAMSRIARENGLFSDARDAAIKAMEAAESDSEKRDSQTLLARAIHDQAMNALGLEERPDEDSLNKAHRLLTLALDGEPGHPAASRLLFGVSLLRRNGPAALKAWRNFFLVPEKETAAGLLIEPARVLNRILPKWQGQVLSVEDQQSLVLAVAQSRFYEYAAVLAANLETRPGYSIGNHPKIKEIVLYAGFIENIKQITDEYYRRIAINKPGGRISRLEKNFRKSLWEEAEGFWNQLQFSGKRPKFKQESFKAEIYDRFGSEFRPGLGGNYSGWVLFMGHLIVDDTIEVEQYRHKAGLRFLVLDSMVSNGYSGWFWDGKAAPGGWSDGSTIVWIRDAYLAEPFFAWRMVADSKVRAETEELIEEETDRDDERARANPYAHLPGLQKRMRFKAAQRLYESLKANGYEGAELCIAFVAEFLRLKVEATIVAHEGRHSIDQLFYLEEFKRWTDEKEFRAKMSQVVFASDPRFAIAYSDILSRNIGKNTNHGIANERIMKTIVEWMGKNTAEIPGIDATRSLLPQFDLLSDDQIKAIFIEADPMAANAAGS